MSIIADDEFPNITLTLKFNDDAMYLFSLLLIITTVYLTLHIIDFTVSKSYYIYNYIKQKQQNDFNPGLLD